MNLNFSLETKDDIITLSLYESKLNSTVSNFLKGEILLVCKEQKISVFVLDIKDVVEADEHGLSALLFADKLSREYDFDLRLANVQQNVLQLMEALMLDQTFAMYDSVEEALEE